MKMKSLFKLVLLYALCDWLAGAAMPFFDLTQIAAAQTAVTGTVRDINGVPFIGGTVLPQFVNVSGGASPTVSGSPLVPATNPVTIGTNGQFSVSVIPNTSISPASTKWQFLICSAPGTAYPDPGSLGSVCFTTGQITITGATQDITGNINAQVVTSAAALTYANLMQSLGSYQGTTSVPITDTAFHALIAASSDIPIPANLANISTRKIKAHFSGTYVNAAASLLNIEVMLCTVSGCGSGTVVAPAGCAVVSTNQANNLTNGQWSLDCTLTTTSTTGSAGTFMAKAPLACFNLGAATSAVQSCFADTVTSVSSAVDETVQEFVNVAFKFSTSNAGNSAIVNEGDVWVAR